MYRVYTAFYICCLLEISRPQNVLVKHCSLKYLKTMMLAGATSFPQRMVSRSVRNHGLKSTLVRSKGKHRASVLMRVCFLHIWVRRRRARETVRMQMGKRKGKKTTEKGMPVRAHRRSSQDGMRLSS